MDPDVSSRFTFKIMPKSSHPILRIIPQFPPASSVQFVIPTIFEFLFLSSVYEFICRLAVSFTVFCSSIGVCAFLECSGLTSVTFPEGLTSIGEGAFKECTRLTSVTFTEGYRTLYSSALLETIGIISTRVALRYAGTEYWLTSSDKS